MKSSRASSATPPVEETPDFRRITRMQTRAARAEMRRQMQSPIEIQEEPIILPTRYPIRRQTIPIVEYITKAPARKPRAKGKSRNTSKPPVTAECEDVQQMSKPAPVARTKTKRVQTEKTITEKEFMFLETLRAKRVDVGDIKIISNGHQQHIIKEDDGNDNSLEEIDHSHNIPTPLPQVPIRRLPPHHHHDIMMDLLYQDIARFFTSHYEHVTNNNNKTCNFFRSAMFHTNTQFHINPPNSNMYGIRNAWCERSNFFPQHPPFF